MTASFIPFNSENIYDRITKIQVPTVEPITDRAGIKRFLDLHKTDDVVEELNREAELSSRDNEISVTAQFPLIENSTSEYKSANLWAKIR